MKEPVRVWKSFARTYPLGQISEIGRFAKWKGSEFAAHQLTRRASCVMTRGFDSPTGLTP